MSTNPASHRLHHLAGSRATASSGTANSVPPSTPGPSTRRHGSRAGLAAAGTGPTVWTSGAAATGCCTTSTTRLPREEVRSTLQLTLSTKPPRGALRFVVIAGSALFGFATSIFLGLWALLLGLAVLGACSLPPVRDRVGTMWWLSALGFTLGPLVYIALGLLLAVFDAPPSGSGTS